MIERVTRQVWNWRWASNLSDTSNTEVTFPNSWKYHISSWSFAAFSSVGIIFPYFLKWVCFPPEDPHKITVLCLNRKSSWRRRVRRAIHHIPTQITWNPQDRKVLFAMFSSGKGVNLQLGALSNMCCDHTQRGACKFRQNEFLHCREVAERGVESAEGEFGQIMLIPQFQRWPFCPKQKWEN